MLVSQKPLDAVYHGHTTIEPSEVGVIPPQYRTQFSRDSFVDPIRESKEAAAYKPDPRASHSPMLIEQWNKEEVCNWLLSLGMEMYIPIFMEQKIGGELLLQIDGHNLKQLGVISKQDRDKIKDKLKELKKSNDKEKKRLEKDSRKVKNSSGGSGGGGGSGASGLVSSFLR